MASDQLLQLAPEEQEKVASWLVAFDETWRDGALADWANEQLPATGDPLRLVALTELAKVDLERQWHAGRRVLLESYLEKYPDLTESGDVLSELIAAEFQVRRQSGDDVKADEYARRFPDQPQALSGLAERGTGVDQESATLPPRPASAECETSRPGSTSGTVAPESKPAADSLRQLPPELDRYQIEKKLGQGGMGAVYLAHDIQLDRKVALKIPYFSESDGGEIADRFLREARAAATIHHPNLCPVYDVGEAGGVHYMTMAFIEGRSLSDYLNRGKQISQRKAAGLVRLLALAIHEAHTRDIIHRDLKPSNIMMNDRNQPVIMDFGLARRSGTDDPALTQSGALLGTPAYMSPEQAQGKLDEVGPCSDIYSLGVIFYELLTGQRPFRGELMEVLAQILAADPEPPSQLRPRLDLKLEAICLKAMAKTPTDRYATAADLGEALTDYLRTTGKDALASSSGQSTSAQSVTAPSVSPPPRPVKKKKPVAKPLSQPPPTPAIKVAPTSTLSRVQKPRVSSTGLTARRKIAIASAAVASLLVICFGIVLLLKTAKGTVRIEISDPDAQVEVSIDGDTIDLKGLDKPLQFKVGEHELTVRGEGYDLHTESFTIKRGDNPPIRVELVRRGSVVDAQHPEDTEVPDAGNQPDGPGLISDRLEHDDKCRYVAFSPDGKLLASAGNDKTVRVWDVATGRELHKLTLAGTPSGGIRFHPQNRFMVAGMYSRSTGGRFRVWTLPEMEEVKPFRESAVWLPPFAFGPEGRFLFSRGAGNSIVIWDLKARTEHARIEGNESALTHLAVSQDGKLLVSTHGGERSVRVWKIETGEQILEFVDNPDPRAPINKAANFAVFTPDAKRVVVGISTHLLAVDLETGEKVWGGRRHTWMTWRGTLTPDGKAIISVGGEGDGDHAQVTNLETGKTVRSLRKYKGAQDVAVHPSRKLIATAGPDKSIKLWHAETWQEIREPLELDLTVDLPPLKPPVTFAPIDTKEDPPENKTVGETSDDKPKSESAAVTSTSPFTNSLGMQFVPVPVPNGPTSGQRVMFSIWETRVQDYRAFAEATSREWPKPEFEQGDDHPAVNVSWQDAVDFCKWLTERERAAGIIGPEQTYRLPSDHEWSCAVGLAEIEDPAATPKDKHPTGYGAKGHYPWGKAEFPQFGNYSGKEHYEGGGPLISSYKDGHATTAPVGSYKANEFGLHDLGGNVWELCDGYYDNDRKNPKRVRRGGCWNTYPLPEMKSNWRKSLSSDGLGIVTGFRCVLSQ